MSSASLRIYKGALLKGCELQRLALSFDVGTELWQPEEDWTGLPPEAWDGHFRPAISDGEGSSPRAYVLHPIDGNLTYLRRGPNAREDESEALQEADLQLDTVSVRVTSAPLFDSFLLSRLLNQHEGPHDMSFSSCLTPSSCSRMSALQRDSMSA